MIFICLYFICSLNMIASKPIQSPILFGPIFFEAVPEVQGKRIHWEDKNIIEADPILKSSLRENVTIVFPNQHSPHSSSFPKKTSHKIEFPTFQVDDRLVLGHVDNKAIEVTEGSVTIYDLDEPSSTTSLEVTNSTFDDTLMGQECLLKDGLIFYHENCSRVLSDLPCENSDQWLIINQFKLPECVKRPCAVEQLLYQDKCYQTSDDSMCSTSEILYVDFSGYVYCDCEQGFIFDGNQCVAEHRRGSCPSGTFLEIQNGVSCVPNPCSSDDLVMNPKDEQCYRKTYEGKCDSDEKHALELSFNFEDFTATCSLTDAIASRNIFEIPASTSCSVGSKRNFMNECKDVFGSFAMPSQFTARYSTCPPMHVRYPNGACKKVNKMI